MNQPPPMKQGHMAIKTQEHEDFNDTRTREHKGTWAHGHMDTWPNEHSDTRTQGHKYTRAQEHTDNHKHKHKHKHKHNNERGRGGSILRGGWRSEVPLQVEERAVEQRWRGGGI